MRVSLGEVGPPAFLLFSGFGLVGVGLGATVGEGGRGEESSPLGEFCVFELFGLGGEGSVGCTHYGIDGYASLC